ncbi:hypothetical protein C8J57DRAFT_1184056 [Mycena rebaudengoi]|nr:hypothetical protein C8J57DRAFT_1184056 [Mycena rebaudengoi]
MFLPLSFLLLLCSPVSLAIHESDVGVIDWHKKLVGIPTSTPVVHHVKDQDILLVSTASNVLGAINITDGSVAWRYVFDAADGIVNFHADGDAVVALSGPAASTVRTLDALTGAIVLEKRLPTVDAFPTSADVSFEPNTGAMFVLNTHTVTRLGEVNWTWTAPGEDLKKLVHTPSALFAVGFSLPASLHLAAIHPISGAQIQTSRQNLPTAVSSVLVSGTTAFWIDPDTQSLGWVPLEPTLKASVVRDKSHKWQSLVDVNLQSLGWLVGVLADGETKVLEVKDNALVQIHTFPANDAAQSLFAGGVAKDGAPYVVRLSTTLLKTTEVDVFTPGQAVATFILPFDPHKHGVITRVAVDGTRLVITTSTGAVQLWEQNQLQWGREEGLATVEVATFVELPLPEHIARAGAEDTFFSRLFRQIGDAKDFPQYAADFAQRFVTGTPPREEVVVSVHDHNASLTRDAFGFKQVLVAATAQGSLFGLDTASGTVLWTRVLGLGWAGDGVGGSVVPAKIFVLDGEGDGKDVVLVAQRRAQNTLVDTVIFRVDPYTGASVAPLEADTDRLLEGTDVISGPLVEAHLLPNSDVIILVDEFLQVNVYPDTVENKALVAQLAPSLHLPFGEVIKDRPRVMGHALKLDPSMSDKHVVYRTWALTLPPGDEVREIIKPRTGPVASLGKVLGNRTTLYKYLNPRMFVVLSQAADIGCGIYVVDGVKGSILYSAVVPGKQGCDVHATLTENWLVYHYYDDEGVGTGETKGWRIVTVELYEGELDEKTQSSGMSAFSEDSMKVEVLEQSYIYAHGITAITTTSTKFGITSKDIIVATHNNKIDAIPRRMLNPRRPKNRKPTAEEQQEEQLIPYDVIMPDDPRRTISHQYEVAKTRNIITSPALLESTSLVFAYGLDLFLTRVAPSNTFDILSKNFNKAQLGLTVFLLSMGIGLGKPMVRRKRLRERWYQ